MSDMTMHAHDGAEGAGDARGAAALAMFLWVVVTVALAYGLYNTVIKGRGPLQPVGPGSRTSSAPSGRRRQRCRCRWNESPVRECEIDRVVDGERSTLTGSAVPGLAV